MPGLPKLSILQRIWAGCCGDGTCSERRPCGSPPGCCSTKRPTGCDGYSIDDRAVSPGHGSDGDDVGPLQNAPNEVGHVVLGQVVGGELRERSRRTAPSACANVGVSN